VLKRLSQKKIKSKEDIDERAFAFIRSFLLPLGREMYEAANIIFSHILSGIGLNKAFSRNSVITKRL
jgi:hypothetical protein